MQSFEPPSPLKREKRIILHGVYQRSVHLKQLMVPSKPGKGANQPTFRKWLRTTAVCLDLLTAACTYPGFVISMLEIEVVQHRSSL